jgi:hypothetical protein
MDDALAVNGETRTANTARSYYNRQTSVDDARNVYQHLNNGRMIVWINAAGEDPRLVQAAIIAMDGREPGAQTEAMYARRVLPHGRLLETPPRSRRRCTERAAMARGRIELGPSYASPLSSH